MNISHIRFSSSFNRHQLSVISMSIFLFMFFKPNTGYSQGNKTILQRDSAYISTDSTYFSPIGGEFTPSKGFDIVRTKYASLNLGVYGCARYVNQFDQDKKYTDHLGNVRAIDSRQDIQWHRTFLWASGFFFTPKFRYTISVWGLPTTNQTLVFGNMQYNLHRALRMGVGIGPNVGTRSVQGAWPFFNSSDRQMADEFFRPGFTGSAFITGEPVKKLFYTLAIGNNLSQVGINANQLTRHMSKSGSLWWMPTTGEFGPRGGNNDLEIHQKLATRFGGSYTHSRENRYNQTSIASPDNTQVKLSDGVLFFQTGALAKDVTVIEADFDLVAFDAGIKFKGLFVQTEVYYRKLSKINATDLADNKVSASNIIDQGFQIQASYPIIKKKLDFYGVYGYVNDQYKRYPYEVCGGLNLYPSGTRSWRINLHIIQVYRSPASSSFGFYVGGQTGTTISIGTDILL